MRYYVQMNLLDSTLLKTLLTLPHLAVCEPMELRTVDQFYILRADGRHCQFSTLEESQIVTWRNDRLVKHCATFYDSIWDLPDVSYSIMSHSVGTTQELHFNLKGIASSSPVKSRIAVITVLVGDDVSYSFSQTGGKIENKFWSELHRNRFVSSVEKQKTSRTWLNSCENVANKLLETYRSRQGTLGGNMWNSGGEGHM